MCSARAALTHDSFVPFLLWNAIDQARYSLSPKYQAHKDAWIHLWFLLPEDLTRRHIGAHPVGSGERHCCLVSQWVATRCHPLGSPSRSTSSVCSPGVALYRPGDQCHPDHRMVCFAVASGGDFARGADAFRRGNPAAMVGSGDSAHHTCIIGAFLPGDTICSHLA